MRDDFSIPWAEAISRHAASTSWQVTPTRALSRAVLSPSIATGTIDFSFGAGSPRITVRASAAV
jgi:hypothetical protein